MKVSTRSKFNCLHSLNSFCYLGLSPVKHLITKAPKFYIAYEKCFRIKILNEDKKWVSRIVCVSCLSNLEAGNQVQKSKMVYGVPTIWRELQNQK